MPILDRPTAAGIKAFRVVAAGVALHGLLGNCQVTLDHVDEAIVARSFKVADLFVDEVMKRLA